jgi:cell division septation protein DedD
MSSTSETETEILLGNRHLLAIFFVLAVLLGIAFTGGYMVGRNSSDKRSIPLVVSSADPAASSNAGASSLETHSLTPAGNEQTDASRANQAADQTRTLQPPPTADIAPPPAKEDSPLGAPKQEATGQEQPSAPRKSEPKPVQAHSKPVGAFAGPQSGQTFLQVTAVGHTEAEALADVLSKKGFPAHAVPKPGSSEIYRVLVGPMHDTSELSNTRDSLRNAGFTKIFVQRY